MRLILFESMVLDPMQVSSSSNFNLEFLFLFPKIQEDVCPFSVGGTFSSSTLPPTKVFG